MITILHAAEEVAQQSKAYVLLMNLAPFILIFVIFYFLLIRPQKKKQAAHKLMIENVKVGDNILLSSGITGKVTKVKEAGYVMVEISSGVEVEILKSYIINVIK